MLSDHEMTCDVLVVPQQRPYDDKDREDIPEVKAHKRRVRKLFDPVAAKNAGLRVYLFDGRNGIVKCSSMFYHRGLLRRPFPHTSLESIRIPHPDDISLHVEAEVSRGLVQRSHILFSAQFWKEGDLVRPWVGPFKGERATVVAVDLGVGSVTIVLADRDVAAGEFDVPIVDLSRVFRQGDTVKIMAGMHRGSTGNVTMSSDDMATVLLETSLEIVRDLHC
jgi:ribosomal protein L24